MLRGNYNGPVVFQIIKENLLGSSGPQISTAYNESVTVLNHHCVVCLQAKSCSFGSVYYTS